MTGITVAGDIEEVKGAGVVAGGGSILDSAIFQLALAPAAPNMRHG